MSDHLMEQELRQAQDRLKILEDAIEVILDTKIALKVSSNYAEYMLSHPRWDETMDTLGRLGFRAGPETLKPAQHIHARPS